GPAIGGRQWPELVESLALEHGLLIQNGRNEGGDADDRPQDDQVVAPTRHRIVEGLRIDLFELESRRHGLVLRDFDLLLKPAAILELDHHLMISWNDDLLVLERRQANDRAIEIDATADHVALDLDVAFALDLGHLELETKRRALG